MPYLGWGLLAAAIIIGCSSAQSTEEPVDEPLPAAPDAKGDDDDDNPKFDPKFNDGGAPKKDASTGQTANCDDPDDPGSAENVATDLPNTSDCDNNYKTVEGVANGPVDVDWYKLSATDEGISVSHPGGCSRDTDFVAEDANMELCVYATCQNSTADAVKGCAKGSPVENSLKMKGCCVEGPGQAIPDLSCSGFPKDDSATFFIRVRQVNTSQCLPYKYRYRF